MNNWSATLNTPEGTHWKLEKLKSTSNILKRESRKKSWKRTSPSSTWPTALWASDLQSFPYFFCASAMCANWSAGLSEDHYTSHKPHSHSHSCTHHSLTLDCSSNQMRRTWVWLSLKRPPLWENSVKNPWASVGKLRKNNLHSAGKLCVKKTLVHLFGQTQ
jgi:hypothetical protein